MKREVVPPRPDWIQALTNRGFVNAQTEGQPYWMEDTCYRLMPAEAEALERAGNEVHKMCLQAVDYVIRNNRLSELSIPEEFHDYIRTSWERHDPSIYGRMDFAYDGVNPPKLLEYNADTPGMLLEASVLQREWREAQKPYDDQFNRIHESLTKGWEAVKASRSDLDKICFAYNQNTTWDGDDVPYLRDAAEAAGFATSDLDMADIGIDSTDNTMVDLDNEPIKAMFKVYPWEYLVTEDGAGAIRADKTQFLEPSWKLILSSKGILPILHELFPGHPNLLPAYHTPEKLNGSYIKKPVFSREGYGASIVTPQFNEAVAGPEGADFDAEGGYVYQAYTELGTYNGYHPVFGVWITNGEASGMGILEEKKRIIGHNSRFVPHCIQRD